MHSFMVVYGSKAIPQGKFREMGFVGEQWILHENYLQDFSQGFERVYRYNIPVKQYLANSTRQKTTRS
jgi:hypothetical protein